MEDETFSFDELVKGNKAYLGDEEVVGAYKRINISGEMLRDAGFVSRIAGLYTQHQKDIDTLLNAFILGAKIEIAENGTRDTIEGLQERFLGIQQVKNSFQAIKIEQEARDKKASLEKSEEEEADEEVQEEPVDEEGTKGEDPSSM